MSVGYFMSLWISVLALCVVTLAEGVWRGSRCGFLERGSLRHFVPCRLENQPTCTNGSQRFWGFEFLEKVVDFWHFVTGHGSQRISTDFNGVTWVTKLSQAAVVLPSCGPELKFWRSLETSEARTRNAVPFRSEDQRNADRSRESWQVWYWGFEHWGHQDIVLRRLRRVLHICSLYFSAFLCCFCPGDAKLFGLLLALHQLDSTADQSHGLSTSQPVISTPRRCPWTRSVSRQKCQVASRFRVHMGDGF